MLDQPHDRPTPLDPASSEGAAEVFRRFAGRLIGLARKRLAGRIQQKVDPEDVVQSVFKSFFRRQADDGFELESWDSLWSLLVVMTVRKCGHKVELLQAARRDVRREAGAGDSIWSSEVAGREPTPVEAAALAEQLAELMAELTEREREMLALRLEGYTTAEIAEQVGRTERTVQRLLRGIGERWQRLCVGDG
jgi:RNA polymerase sigma-70 factor (ECF subfamily)